MSSSLRILSVIVTSLLLSIAAQTLIAQSTEFTYQGSLQNGGTAASDTHDFELLLFDAASGGTQLGPTLTRNAAAVSSGVFSIKLGFGGQYTGGQRFLDVRVRQTRPFGTNGDVPSPGD